MEQGSRETASTLASVIPRDSLKACETSLLCKLLLYESCGLGLKFPSGY